MLLKPSECRYRQRCSPANFRQRLHCAVFHHPDLKPEEVAARAEIPLHVLQHYANDNQDRHIPAERLVKVIRVTGRLDLLDVLAAEIGCLVTRAAEPGAGLVDVAAEVLDTTAAHGRLSAEVRSALADGRLDERERSVILAAVREEQRELAELESCVQAAASREWPAGQTRRSA